jgi:hypothetical protein
MEESMRPQIRLWIVAAFVAGTIAAFSISPDAKATGDENSRRANGGAVYVMGQGLYYDTFVTVDPLEPNGPFQKLYPPDDDHPFGRTQYGPGDPEYLGGRWWEDVNHNDKMDSEDHYFLCPLLGPGRDTL